MSIFLKKNYIYIPIFGGLGNQMFQMAHALNISTKLKNDLALIDYTNSIGSIERNWNLDCFGFKPTNISPLQKGYINNIIRISNLSFKLGSGKRFGVLNEEHLINKNEYKIINKKIFIGYWQNENYFSDYLNDIRNIFSFNKKLLIPDYLKKNIKENTVAIHIRRGDYISNKKTKYQHLICDDNWYLKAFELIKNLVSNPKFYIFSDDLKYAKELFKEHTQKDIAFVPEDERDWFHMYLMTYCKSFIISNSSYSWWGSFLAKENINYIICPKYWNRDKLTKNMGICRKNFLLL